MVPITECLCGTQQRWIIMMSKKNENDKNMYSFGFRFIYDIHKQRMGKEEHRNIYRDYLDGIFVVPKYHDLKQELTSNTISTLTMSQFNHLHNKAIVYFNSAYRKQYIQPWENSMLIPIRRRHVGPLHAANNNMVHNEQYINMKHIMCLMVYCNYTNLQYEFSKTYRINHGADHSQFYHLGKYLQH
eukprot:1013088_1